MCQGFLRFYKTHVSLYWTPVEAIFYKLCLSACHLRSLSIFLSSSPFTPCQPYLSSPSEVWVQIKSFSCFNFFFCVVSPPVMELICPGCPCLNAGMFVCVRANVCLGLSRLLTWTDCQRCQCARQQHVARPIDPYRGMCRVGIQSCIFEGNWSIEEVKLFVLASEKVTLNALASELLCKVFLGFWYFVRPYQTKFGIFRLNLKIAEISHWYRVSKRSLEMLVQVKSSEGNFNSNNVMWRSRQTKTIVWTTR